MKTTDAMSVDEGEGASENRPSRMGIGRWPVALSVQSATRQHGPVRQVSPAHSVAWERAQGSSSIPSRQNLTVQRTAINDAVLLFGLAQNKLTSSFVGLFPPLLKGGHSTAAANLRPLNARGGNVAERVVMLRKHVYLPNHGTGDDARACSLSIGWFNALSSLAKLPAGRISGIRLLSNVQGQ